MSKFPNFQKDVEEICNIFDQSRLKYFLDSGSLLGAVRNQRFIPHDKDIDFGIIDHHGDGLSAALSILRKRNFHIVLKRHSMQFVKSGIPISCTFYTSEKDNFISFWGAPKTQGIVGLLLRTCFWFTADHYKEITFSQSIFLGFTFKYFILVLSKYLPNKLLSRLSLAQRKFGPKYVWVIPRDLVKLGNRIKFEGTECSAPKNPENYLRFRYGENWRVQQENWSTSRDDGCLHSSEYFYR